MEVPSFVTETTILDRELGVATANQEVTVAAEAETVQTTTSTPGTVINTQAVAEFPLSTRNYTIVLNLSGESQANVNNAIAIGKGSQAILVNGSNEPRTTSRWMVLW